MALAYAAQRVVGRIETTEVRLNPDGRELAYSSVAVACVRFEDGEVAATSAITPIGNRGDASIRNARIVD